MNSLSHPAFNAVSSQIVDALNITVEEYEHIATGARHYHLASDSDENVFLVALRTVPQDSTGVAHILEHTALCGSERYPVRDPFFMMIRRSLNTFMNAFTSSDWTAYPFASQNRKDFDNLLQVYLDAVFFSRLDPLDFAQEGHRLEFAEQDNPNSELLFKGVVFNEMKGAMSSVTSQLWHTFCKYLYPTSTYHFNSGGDPESITDLSYQQLVDFYRSHYHPSNAIFMTFGDIPAAEHQQNFQDLALARFDKSDQHVAVSDEKRYLAPLSVSEYYPVDDSELNGKTHIVIGWLLGKSMVLEDLLEAEFLSSVLLDNSSSPLLKELETTSLGSAPSPLCGLEDSNRELSFSCGIEGSDPDKVAELEALVINTLQRLAREGVEAQRLQSVLHQLEIQQREIGGDGYPYGLQLIMAALGPATHRGNPVDVLDVEPVLARLRERISDPQYIKDLIKKLLLDNPHRITLVLKPDAELDARKNAAESAQLARIKDALSAQEAQEIVHTAKALEARQSQADDASILPKVSLSDVPPATPALPFSVQQVGPAKRTVSSYPRGTNGIAYQQFVLPLPALSAAQLDLLPLYCQCLSELGVGKRDYLETQSWQAAVSGSLGAYSRVNGAIDDEQAVQGFLTLSGKGLQSNISELNQLMLETLQDVRFDEQQRVSELIAQTSARRERSITGNGHGLAMMAACGGMSPTAALAHQQSGLNGIRWIKQQLSVDASAICTELQALHALLQNQTFEVLLISEAQGLASMVELAGAAQGTATGVASTFSLPTVREPRRQAWQTATQVNFCARAFPTVCVEHADSAALTVLGNYLRNGHLHTAIREQGGAYGAGAGQDSANACFRFYSYRDPRLQETLADFDASIDWLQASTPDPQAVEEAILGVIGGLDKPGSPAGQAKQQFHNQLYGRDSEQRARFRQRILAVNGADLQRCGDTYLRQSNSSCAVISNETTLNANSEWLEQHAMTVETLS